MTLFLLALACKGDESALDSGLYLQVPQEDGSCQVFDGETLLFCLEQAGDCAPLDGLTVTLSEQACPEAPTIACEPDNDWPSYFYGESASTDAFAFCQSCTGEPSPASLCPLDQDGDGSPETEDCDDTDPEIYPGAVDICDSLDNDCDGDIDEDEISFGECVDGIAVCEEARFIQGTECVLWREAWLGPYTFEVEYEDETIVGEGTLVEDAAGPDHMYFESETAPFSLQLADQHEGFSDFGGLFSRYESGVVTLMYACEGTFTPNP